MKKLKIKLIKNYIIKYLKNGKKIGDILIADFSILEQKDRSVVASVYGEILRVKTVLQKNKINGELRIPKTTEILFGKDTKTEITEYGIKYRLDLSKVMWSPGNTDGDQSWKVLKELGIFINLTNQKPL